MTQYIDKSALVERIKKLKMDIGNIFSEYDEGFWEGRDTAFDDVIYALDTLKVKEVDSDYIKDELDKAIKIYKPGGDFGWGTLYNIATHFFELGMAVSNNTQKGE